jgi:hypothetical protein
MTVCLLDNDPVAYGDHVYDVVYGQGEVIELRPDGRFRVEFSAFRTVVYNSTGHSKNNRGRTLYWRDPVLVTPTKSDATWTLIQRLVTAIITEMRR